VIHSFLAKNSWRQPFKHSEQPWNPAANIKVNNNLKTLEDGFDPWMENSVVKAAK
jgi:hypothetical protein